MSLDTLRTAKKVIGVKQTIKAVEKDMASLVFIAQNADSKVTAPLKELCIRKDIPIQLVATMDELGASCGIQVGAAALAVLK